LNIANDAERVRILAQRLALVLTNTIFMKARRMHLLILAAIARMTTVQEGSTAAPSLPLTLLLRAIVVPLVSLEHSGAESAFSRILFPLIL
jgi:hypothetical protein